MPSIHLTTFVAAPAERVFDLSRSIELHKKSMAHTGEKAVSGTTAGLIRYEETVTWKAKHLFKERVMRVRVTEMNQPYSFTGEMVEGDLRSMKHEHHFKKVANGTLMINVLNFSMPYGLLGRLAATLFLSRYLKKLLEHRNSIIKQYAESDKWQFVLNN
jgi:ligand-binding SRPBCC domain-containing protein